jgi:hypothetical protein
MTSLLALFLFLIRGRHPPSPRRTLGVMTTLTSTEDVPSLRRTLESLQRQHAALDAEERMLELKVSTHSILWFS